MKITRIQGAIESELDTHTTKWFRQIFSEIWRIKHYSHGRIDWDMEICDPFARNCQIAGEWTNDINENTHANHNMDALEFLKFCPSASFDLVIFDPPFSEVQAERKYKTETLDQEIKNVYTVPSYVPDCMKEIQRILKPGGWFLKFGYNTNSSHSDFELRRIWIVHYAGNKNDTLISYFQMNQRSLEEWCE